MVAMMVSTTADWQCGYLKLARQIVSMTRMLTIS